MQRVNSGAAGPSPRTAGLSPRGPSAWAHDSGPEVVHHDLLRAGGDTDAMAGATVDLSATDSGRAAAVGTGVIHAFPHDSGGAESLRSVAYGVSRSSSPANGEPPRGAQAHPADQRGFVSDAGRPGPMAYMTAFPALDDSQAGSSDRAMAMLGQSSMLPSKNLVPGYSSMGTAASGSPLGGPAVGNPALQAPPVTQGHIERELSQDSLLDSAGGGSTSHLSEDCTGMLAEPGPDPAFVAGYGDTSRGVVAAAGGGASIESTVSPMDTAVAGGGPSIASTITPAPSRDGASASRIPESDENFSLPVMGAMSWANPAHAAVSGGSGGFPAMHDEAARRRGLAASAAQQAWAGQGPRRPR